MDNVFKSFNGAREEISGRVCLITGGGGSIGSELARIAAQNGAEKIILLDIYENGAYNVQRELGDKAVVEIASVRDADRVENIFSQYKPSLVFHTAAHKHVPFMESNPEEAVKNNIRGTQITADAAERHGAEVFVLISTDKAVEPISIMGASKRVCEMLVYEKSLTAEETRFLTVRFGNVVNSNGSVIPLFQKQLGTGVLTVTHSDVSRYFITIPEAAEHIVTAAALSSGGEIFVPDMGESRNILEIAEEVIRRGGMEPYKDVKIEFIGLRQGDKLSEKLFYDFEKPRETSAAKLYKVHGSSAEGLFDMLGELYRMSEIPDREGIRKKLFEITSNTWRI